MTRGHLGLHTLKETVELIWPPLSILPVNLPLATLGDDPDSVSSIY